MQFVRSAANAFKELPMIRECARLGHARGTGTRRCSASLERPCSRRACAHAGQTGRLVGEGPRIRVHAFDAPQALLSLARHEHDTAAEQAHEQK